MTGNVLERLLSRYKRPQRVVSLCFIIVFIFSTVLTWREAVVLEGAYASDQRRSLNNIATLLDRQLQHGIDNLLFYRKTMRYALQSPISTDKSRQALTWFDMHRTDPYWQLRLDLNRGIPINGVSDEFVSNNNLPDRNNSLIHAELSAMLELSIIMQLSDRSKNLQRRTLYASRSGFFLSSTPPENNPDIILNFYQLVTQRRFFSQSPQSNPGRGVLWSDATYADDLSGQIITASVPLDYDGRWYGVLAMDFPVSSIHRFLSMALHNHNEGTVMLYDSRFNKIVTSDESALQTALFGARQQAEITAAMEKGEEGELRMGSRFITWAKLHNFDGMLIKVHTLEEGMRGEFGRISIVLTILWTLFSLMLLVSWGVISRLVRNMMELQQTLTWRANFDTLTHLYNRGAFFDVACSFAVRCKEQRQPFSVIQLDLDFFKKINDLYGHHVGDKVLAQSAALLSAALRAEDVAGRVGGEEFCVVLPGTSLSAATQIAERIRVCINSKALLLKQGATLKISASFGVSCSQEQFDYNFEVLQSIADRRLYKAKQGGRNQVCAQD